MPNFERVLVGLVVLQAGCVIPIDGSGVTPDAAVQASFNVALSPSAEVPVCASAGIAAMGSTTVTISADETMVTVRALTFTGLSGPATGAHIHAGAPGDAGPIVLDLGTRLIPPIDVTFTASSYPVRPPEGAPATFAAFIDQMKAGLTYVNVHTIACPSGEIRGQLL